MKEPSENDQHKGSNSIAVDLVGIKGCRVLFATLFWKLTAPPGKMVRMGEKERKIMKSPKTLSTHFLCGTGVLIQTVSGPSDNV